MARGATLDYLSASQDRELLAKAVGKIESLERELACLKSTSQPEPPSTPAAAGTPSPKHPAPTPGGSDGEGQKAEGNNKGSPGVEDDTIYMPDGQKVSWLRVSP